MKKRRISSHLISNEEEPALNLTPLIDVVFVVLILFILIAPMLEVDKVELAGAPPLKENKQTAKEAIPLAIHVHADNSIWIHSKKIPLEALSSLLKQEKTTKPNQVPQLFHDKKAQFGTYQTVKNALEVAGFEELDVILEPGRS